MNVTKKQQFFWNLKNHNYDFSFTYKNANKNTFMTSYRKTIVWNKKTRKSQGFHSNACVPYTFVKIFIFSITDFSFWSWNYNRKFHHIEPNCRRLPWATLPVPGSRTSPCSMKTLSQQIWHLMLLAEHCQGSEALSWPSFWRTPSSAHVPRWAVPLVLLLLFSLDLLPEQS